MSNHKIINDYFVGEKILDVSLSFRLLLILLIVLSFIKSSFTFRYHEISNEELFQSLSFLVDIENASTAENK